MYRFEVFAVWALIIILLAIAALGIFGAIYSIPILDEGVVVGMEYEPSRTTYHYRKIGAVSQMVPMRDDEDWVLVVRGITDAGKERTERWEVTRETYEQTQVGDLVTRIEE